MSFGSKKTLIFRLYQVLHDYSGIDNPLTQQRIIDLLASNYDIEVERKAIGRNISYLREMGYEIVSGWSGSYLDDKNFDESEIRLLIDSVLCSKYINPTHSKELINKIIELGGTNFKSHVKHVYSVNDWGKSANQAFLYNIEIVVEAIEKGKIIGFDYNKYDIDKKLHKTNGHKVSPYQMILHNQHYFLMCYEEYWGNMAYYRMDKITNIHIAEDVLTPIRTIEGYKNGIDYKVLATAYPYMFADKLEEIELACESWFIDEIIDWFGKDVCIQELENDAIMVRLKASPKAMEYWAMQYGTRVEVTHPQHLRDKIKENVANMTKKYCK